jgi:hypothetical protein
LNPLEETPLSLLARDAHNDLPTLDEFSAALAKRKAPVKALLLDQDAIISGIGNYLIDEICYQSRVRRSPWAGKSDGKVPDRYTLLSEPIPSTRSSSSSCTSKSAPSSVPPWAPEPITASFPRCAGSGHLSFDDYMECRKGLAVLSSVGQGQGQGRQDSGCHAGVPALAFLAIAMMERSSPTVKTAPSASTLSVDVRGIGVRINLRSLPA